MHCIQPGASRSSLLYLEISVGVQKLDLQTLGIRLNQVTYTVGDFGVHLEEMMDTPQEESLTLHRMIIFACTVENDDRSPSVVVRAGGCYMHICTLPC